VAWNPTKPLLASCSSDKSVLLNQYDLNSNFTTVASIPTEHAKTVRSVAWAPSGEKFATASFDANIGVWERRQADDDEERTWECASSLEGHETECKCVAYSPTGTLLASCSRDKTVWVWEVQPDNEFECMGVLMSHSQDVKCVVWHPTEEILASGSYDDTIKLYIDDPSDDWYDFQTLTGHDSTVWSLAFSPDGNYLASASDDRTIRIWKRAEKYKWDCVSVLKGHERTIFSIDWSKARSDDGSLGWLASTGGDGKVNIWDIRVNESSSTLSAELIACVNEAHGVHDVNSVSWCPREGFEDLLATAGDDCSVKVWRIKKQM